MSKIIPSAYKHGFTDADILCAWDNYVWQIVEVQEPPKVIRLGYDSKARALEVGGVFDSEDWLIIHAMKARKKYLQQVPMPVRGYLL
ncbi:hypothetical protein HMPREF0578_1517 [Mobiluncus mulieris 28-1]|uniref:Toxin-antitoxin system, toxin component n=2 Tax=Mobiluncus mulieris TaxID=2052 RepID=E0QNU1_9ACTO|nr:hypothetical protein [Mobiluncus mulieris]EEJ52890.1 hypothetical protein HMPREF0577_2203 [Mobiluncus mulieris ATCC 35243]EEZ92187.1 hypothetical protein HMPREF0578_1517 [Mobiluncus mulieris 28-1]EFM46837.1 hypothetical protein HMPREF0580_0555 [Mobiluncus mulieris ATCC 35239]EFN92507.1 hypothetical protein HMPREF9278_0091 [Mobiluncus mulieris FB024-16]MBB5847028.1 hypothetical protein [Mobiluncus mulieris]